MNHRLIKALALLLVVGLAVAATSCKLLHEKVIEIVLNSSACMDFEEREDSAQFTTPETVDVADDIDDALSEAGVSRDDLVEARLIGATYEVTWLDDPGHDWEIEGEIILSYAGEESTIVDYSEQSLYDALGAGKIKADLNQSGVNLFNKALGDYMDGWNPVLTFTVSNDACTPSPSPSDSLKFDWTGCMHMYIIVEQEPDVIDPF